MCCNIKFNREQWDRFGTKFSGPAGDSGLPDSVLPRGHCNADAKSSAATAVSGTGSSVGNAVEDFTKYKVACFLYSLNS